VYDEAQLKIGDAIEVIGVLSNDPEVTATGDEDDEDDR
jgi:hypothetical protein